LILCHSNIERFPIKSLKITHRFICATWDS